MMVLDFRHDLRIGQLIDALANESGAPIEQHATGFGSILVARLLDARPLDRHPAR